MKDLSNLDHSRSQPLPQAGVPSDNFSSSSPELPSGGLLEYWRILQRRKVTIVVIAVIGMCAAFLYTIPQTSIYQARTVIEIQTLNEDFLNIKDVDPNSSAWDPTIELQTQVRILQSDSLLARVTEKIAGQRKGAVPPPSRASAWRRFFHLSDGTAAPGNASAAVTNLRVRVEPNTRLIEILCDSPDPRVAAAFANTLTAEFIEQSLQARWETTQHTGDFLDTQMQDLKTKLENDEDVMQAYARNNNLVITDEKNNAEDQKLSQLQSELSTAQGDLIQHQSQYELARDAPVDSLGEIIDDSTLKGIQAQLIDLRRQYADLDTIYTPADKKIPRLKVQIAALESAQQLQRANILNRVRNDYTSAQRRVSLIAADYANTATIVAAEADKMTHYNTLKREVDTDRQLYDSMLQRVKEASVASALRASNIHVVDPAAVPASPYSPNTLNNSLLGLFSGAVFGIAFVIFLDRADRTIQEPGDTPFYIGVPELGIVPSASIHPAQPRWSLPLKRQAPPITSREMALTTLESKPSALTESFRATLTSIMFSGVNGVPPQVLVVSSASPKEGKTTLTTNLAVALAEIHKRVLLIDCDLRRPSIHRFFNLEKETGLVELLRRTEPIVGPINGNIHPSGVPNLSIMTSGSTVEGDPTLLHSNRLIELIELMRHEYDMVLIDTPAMLSMSDARVVARLADGVILVVRANITSRDSVKDAYCRFVDDGTSVIGTVLNDWDPRKSSRYGYSRYYDRFRQYYAEPSAHN
jgi:capsular exopolysaccharide synthesis family protein